jgi:indole-3-glycerol phosphate synthase
MRLGSPTRSIETVTILDEILDNKRRELDSRVARVSEAEMARRADAATDAPRGFRSALASADAPVVIAEVKRRSPSKGLIRADFDPESCARAYARGGAAALSVLTDEDHFGGHLDYLTRIRAVVSLPLLRKDFLIDAYQVDEARVAGADAILLIAAALPPEALLTLRKRALELGLDVLVEVHDEAELEFVLSCGADLIGVNNRDLRTFEVDLATTERLAARLPQSGDVLLVAESGIRHFEDTARLAGAGAGAFLVGESLMRQPDMAEALQQLRRSS